MKLDFKIVTTIVSLGIPGFSAVSQQFVKCCTK